MALIRLSSSSVVLIIWRGNLNLVQPSEVQRIDVDKRISATVQSVYPRHPLYSSFGVDKYNGLTDSTDFFFELSIR